ncbi:hypothetical protein JCM8202_000861 [Rhodotorula sphaerocarpa]
MADVAEPPAPAHEPTTEEILAAGAPLYAGSVLDEHVHADSEGLLYIGSYYQPSAFRKDPRTRSVILPVKRLALVEEHREQGHVQEAGPTVHLQLKVGIESLQVERGSPETGDSATWLHVPANRVSFVKRWDTSDGSGVLIAVAFTTQKPSVLVLLLEMDVHAQLPPDGTSAGTPIGFDPLALDHMKAFFESWTDPIRALAIPSQGQAPPHRPTLREGFDPLDSTTWVPPFGPIDPEQEARYFADDPGRRAGPSAAAPPAESDARADSQRVATLGLEGPMPLFTQSGRAVKRRLPNPDSVFDAILAESEFDAHGGGTGAGVKGASASGRKPAKRARARTSTPIAAVAAPAEAMPATVGPAARDPATAPPALQARDASPNVVAPKPSVPAGEAGRPDPAAAALPSASSDASLGQ